MTKTLRDLVIDIKRRGVLAVPLLVRAMETRLPHQYDGHRRHAARREEAGLERVPCVVFEQGRDGGPDYGEAQLVTQLHSQAMAPAEVYTGCKHWMVLHPHVAARELALSHFPV